MKQGKNNEIDSGDYYVINGIKILKDDPNLIFDYTSKKYESLSQHKNHVFLEGIVGFHKNGKIKKGWFRRNKFVNITIVTSNGTNHAGVDYELVRGNYSYRENTSNGYFYYYKILSAISFSSQRAIQRQEKNSLPYNLGGQYQKDFEEAFAASKIVPRKEVKPIAKLLDGLSFGLEFETTLGYVPPRLTGGLGLAPLRDGSIDGIEYVTVPLQGEKGLEGLIQSLELLEERTSFDNSCSLHLHIGNIPRTKEFILALFIASIYLQDEMFKLFPVTKRFNWGIKNKNYTKPYNPLDMFAQFDNSISSNNLAKNFNIFINNLAVSNQYANASLSDVHTHPQDPNNDRKWNISTRYYWLNFIPILFANKATVEFRIHTPTFNVHKILSYLLICGGIVNYVKKNKSKILASHRQQMYNRQIEDIVYGAGNNDKINNAIYEYIRARKYGAIKQNCAGNIQGDESKITAYNVLGPSYGKIVRNKSIFKPKKINIENQEGQGFPVHDQPMEVYIDNFGNQKVRPRKINSLKKAREKRDKKRNPYEAVATSGELRSSGYTFRGSLDKGVEYTTVGNNGLGSVFFGEVKDPDGVSQIGVDDYIDVEKSMQEGIVSQIESDMTTINYGTSTNNASFYEEPVPTQYTNDVTDAHKAMVKERDIIETYKKALKRTIKDKPFEKYDK